MVYNKILKFSNHEFNEITKFSLMTWSINDIYQIQNILEILLTTVIFAPIYRNWKCYLNLSKVYGINHHKVGTVNRNVGKIMPKPKSDVTDSN